MPQANALRHVGQLDQPGPSVFGLAVLGRAGDAAGDLGEVGKPASLGLAREIQAQVETRMTEIVAGTAGAAGVRAALRYERNYPVTVNDPAKTDFATAVAREVAGDAHVDSDFPPTMGAEDFSYMLEARPGAMIWVGNGDSAALHSPAYDFNDDAIPFGCSYWARLVETAMPAG